MKFQLSLYNRYISWYITNDGHNMNLSPNFHNLLKNQKF